MIERIPYDDIPLLLKEGDILAEGRNGDLVTIYDYKGEFKRAFYIRRDSYEYREVDRETWRSL